MFADGYERVCQEPIFKGCIRVSDGVTVCVSATHLCIRVVRDEGVARSQRGVGGGGGAGGGRRGVQHRGLRRGVDGRGCGVGFGEVHECVFEGGEVESAEPCCGVPARTCVESRFAAHLSTGQQLKDRTIDDLMDGLCSRCNLQCKGEG